MPDKDPTTWTLATWMLGFAMASAGGLVNWYAKYKRSTKKEFNWLELAGEMFTSGFVGVCVFILLCSFDSPTGICAAGAGIGGHMSTKLLALLETKILSKIQDTEIK